MKKILWVVLLPTCAYLRADVIFDTLNGPQVAGYQVSGQSAGFGPESLAASFASSSAFSLTSAAVQVLAIQGSTFDMALFSSDANGLPGAQLATIGTNLTAPGTSGVVGASAPVALTLAAQTQYWLVLTPATDETQVSWGVVSGVTASPVSTTIETNGAGGWNLVGHEPLEFEIAGSPETPEPGTLALLTVSAGVMLLLKWRWFKSGESFSKCLSCCNAAQSVSRADTSSDIRKRPAPAAASQSSSAPTAC
jgi:hypothetical protein